MLRAKCEQDTPTDEIGNLSGTSSTLLVKWNPLPLNLLVAPGLQAACNPSTGRIGHGGRTLDRLTVSCANYLSKGSGTDRERGGEDHFISTFGPHVVPTLP